VRVAVDANVLSVGHGGIPRYLLRITERLAAAGDEVFLLANRFAWPAPVPGVRTVGLRVKGLDRWRSYAVPAWVAARGMDVLWAPETILPPRTPRAATVCTVHDLAPLLWPESKPPSVLRQFETTIPRSVRSATRVLCVSQQTAGDVERLWGVGPDRVRVVPNGVDATFAPGDRAQAQAAVAARYGVGEPFVLHVGSIEPRKGLDVLIAASARQPGWRLVLAGGLGHDGERIAAAARTAGAVVLAPPDDAELLALYRAADAVAAPALYEGFGIVPLEAMACGTPAVIAAGAGALEEISGAAAVVVAERTPDAWLAGIERARAERAARRDRGVALAASYGWDDVATRTRAVLAEAVAARRG
jgi:glycosyltransferase involved in cell wall biosynthesis